MATGRPSPIGPHPAGIARHFPERIGGRTKLDEHLPVDHRLSKVYRVGAGLTGLVLVAFGILGLIDEVGFFDTGGDTVAGLNTNGALSVLSIAIGLLLFIGMVIGANFASTLNIVLGILFLLSGFINLALLETPYNFLAFQLQNVLFSFVVGLMLMWFGMYGRVSGGLPHDNPYWLARHPEQAEREARARGGAIARHRAVESGGGAEGEAEAEERTGPRAKQPPGKWGKLDRPGRTDPAPDQATDQATGQTAGQAPGQTAERPEQAEQRRARSRWARRRRREELSGGAPGSTRPRP